MELGKQVAMGVVGTAQGRFYSYLYQNKFQMIHIFKWKNKLTPNKAIDRRKWETLFS